MWCVDGIHFKIFKLSPFSKDWNSHKLLGGAALSYELVTCIATGEIVAFLFQPENGMISRSSGISPSSNSRKLNGHLVILVSYRGARNKILTKVDARDRQHSYAMGCARDRHETVNH